MPTWGIAVFGVFCLIVLVAVDVNWGSVDRDGVSSPFLRRVATANLILGLAEGMLHVRFDVVVARVTAFFR